MTAGNAEDPLAEQLRQREAGSFRGATAGPPDTGAKPATNPYTRSAALSQKTAQAHRNSRAGLSNVATRGLCEEIRKEDSLWYRMGRQLQGPPWWVNGL